VQGTAEGAPFRRTELDALLGLAEGGLTTIFAAMDDYVASPPSPR
jgi:ribonuclease PH